MPPIDIVLSIPEDRRHRDWAQNEFRSPPRRKEASEVRPVIDQVFPFADYREAYRRFESGNHVGKVIVDLAD